jgi:YHS domain-containing protein
MAIDPVCDMEVDSSTAEFKSEYNGEEYYFCSDGCKSEFDEDPENFVNME